MNSPNSPKSPLCLIVLSDQECEQILLSIGLLGLTKPAKPHTLTVTPVRFRREGTTWVGFSLHHAHHPAAADNGYQILAVEAPLTPEKRAFLDDMLPLVHGPIHSVPIPAYPEN